MDPSRLDDSGESNELFPANDLATFRYGDCSNCYEQGIPQSACTCRTVTSWCSRESLSAAVGGAVLGAGIGAAIAAGAYESSSRCSSGTGNSGFQTAAQFGYAVSRAASSAAAGDFHSAYDTLANAYSAVADAGVIAGEEGGFTTFPPPRIVESAQDADRTAAWVNAANAPTNDGDTPAQSHDGAGMSRPYQGSFPDLV